MLFPPKQPPNPPPRVVVAGAGIVTALGVGWGENAEGFRVGRVAIRPVTLFDVSRQRVKSAGEAELPPHLPDTLLPARHIRRLDRAAKLLLHAAHEAWQQSGWNPSEDLPVVLPLTAFRASAFFRGGMAAPEFVESIHQSSEYRVNRFRALHYKSVTIPPRTRYLRRHK